MPEEDEADHKGRLERLKAFFKRKPDSALRTLYSDVEKMEGLHSYAVAGKYTVEADEPVGLGGTDDAPTPTELLMSALAHCQAITLRIYARGMGIQLDSVKVKVTGTVDLRGYFSIPDEDGGRVRSAIEEVVIKTYIESKEPPERVQALIDAVRGRGVCLSSVEQATPLRLSFRLNGERLG
jgi:uncharacterized OsmC-like protein